MLVRPSPLHCLTVSVLCTGACCGSGYCPELERARRGIPPGCWLHAVHWFGVMLHGLLDFDSACEYSVLPLAHECTALRPCEHACCRGFTPVRSRHGVAYISPGPKHFGIVFVLLSVQTTADALCACASAITQTALSCVDVKLRRRECHCPMRRWWQRICANGRECSPQRVLTSDVADILQEGHAGCCNLGCKARHGLQHLYTMPTVGDDRDALRTLSEGFVKEYPEAGT